MNYPEILSPIQQFLHCPTPASWVDFAKKPANLPMLLQDHLLCELKAAQTAMLLLRKYAVDQEGSLALLEWLKPFENFAYRFSGDANSLKNAVKLSRNLTGRADVPYADDIIEKMVLLIREELHHFYQVLEIMESRGIAYSNISAGRYAKSLISQCKTHEPQILIDKLICGAIIEARSCERFAVLATVVDGELSAFYQSLLRSEARHFEDYLTLAKTVAGRDINDRVQFFLQYEANLIQSADADFKFHSGPPADLMTPT